MHGLMSLDASNIQLSFDYVTLSAAPSTKITGLNPAHIKGEHVIVMDGVYDSGRTLNQAVKYVNSLEPKSVRTAVLLQKCNPQNLAYSLRADFVGYG